MAELRYVPEPTASRFHESDSFVRCLMGPIGSGKSVSCVEELKRLAISVQAPGSDKVRRTRFAVVRNTYPELRSTTIKTWQDWFPPSICSITTDKPITGRMRVALGDGTQADMEVFFLALDKPDDVRKLLSMELTAVWLNEFREIPKAILDGATGRVGRYPPKREGGPTFPCIIMDTNPPDDDHWYYTLAEEEKPEGWCFFHQPPALLEGKDGKWSENPEAENICHLPDGYEYYFRQLSGKSRQWIRVYIEGRYGTVMDGRPVYPEWRDETHFSRELLIPDKKSGLLLGWDFGLTPCVIIGQISARGRLMLLAELVSERMGLRQFVRLVVKPYLAANFSGYSIVLSCGDPAGSAASQADEQSCLDVLNDEGIETIPAPTNALEPRLSAVRDFLCRLVDGKPGVVVSGSCPVLRKGFNGGYKFERVQVSGEERFRDKPCKNRYSHIHDALQYLALAAGREYETLYESQVLVAPGPGVNDELYAGELGYVPAGRAGY
ncbi:MAG: TerL [Candidatus Thiodiazotropha weberae]|nr:TerL [Candidatus Thiodiazotropha weberae]